MIMCYSQRSMLRALCAITIASALAVTMSLSRAALAHEADGHPARIHEGSCGAIGRVTDQLTGVGAEITPEGTPVPEVEMVGSEMAIPSDVSTTTLDAKIGELVDTPHAIVVYESDEAMDRMLVCGNVGGPLMMEMPGMPMPGDELPIWLAPQDDSAYTGIALLRSEVGGKSTVTIVLAEGVSGGAATESDHGHETTPEATPITG
jgi:hypothetical protein